MTRYPESPTAIWPNPHSLPKLNDGNKVGFAPQTSVKQGYVSIDAELQHFSVIVYMVPSSRVISLVPHSLSLEEFCREDHRFTWISIISYLDQGSHQDGQDSFEQTSYCLHVMRDGQPSQWLLGISIGSLSAVAIRNLWPMPWHLSAMEFKVAYDKSKGHYREYKLHTQSQWENASWEITDTGKAFLPNRFEQPLPSSFARDTFNNYFLWRDRSLGLYRIRYPKSEFTDGRLIYFRSELLESHGLLTREELQHPSMVAIQHKMSCQVFSSAVLGGTNNGYHKIGFDLSRLAIAS